MRRIKQQQTKLMKKNKNHNDAAKRLFNKVEINNMMITYNKSKRQQIMKKATKYPNLHP